MAQYSLRDLRLSADAPMLKKWEDLFHSGAVTLVEGLFRTYVWKVRSWKNEYHVELDKMDFDCWYCDCYMGNRDEYCKHLLALTLFMIDKQGSCDADLPKTLMEYRIFVKPYTSKIRSYSWPSSIWFEYQRKLEVGSAGIIEWLSEIEMSRDVSRHLWSMVKRYSKRLAESWIDDSNGFVWDMVEWLVLKIVDIAHVDVDTKQDIEAYKKFDTGFWFEDIFHKNN